MTTIEKRQPLPSEAAKRGLYKIETVDVHFKRVAKADEKAALAYLSDLIHWWNLPWREWRPRKKG